MLEVNFSKAAKEKNLGHGTFGKVARYTINGVAYAVKRSAFDEKEHRHNKKRYGYQADFLYECDILKKFRGCTGILMFEGIFFDPSGDCYIMTELMDMSLDSWYESNNYATRVAYLPEIIQQVGTGLACLHRHGYIHNDFKDDNVLISLDSSGKMTAKICDFGKTWLAQHISKYHGIAKVRPPYQVLSYYDQEKWAFAVTMTNTLIGHDLCHEYNKKVTYSNYMCSSGFDIEAYLRKNLSAAELAAVPAVYWKLVKPIFQSLDNMMPELSCIIPSPTDVNSFTPKVPIIQQSDLGYEDSQHYGVHMRALASHISLKLKRRLTDKELEAIYLIFTNGKAGKLFSLTSETEAYEYQAKMLHVADYQILIKVV